MNQFLIVAICSLCGGFVQAVTGFGGGIVIMLLLPLLFEMTIAAAISDVITMVLSFALFWQYRKHIKRSLIAAPAICYLLVSILTICLSGYLGGEKLKLMFGIFLIVLAAYFLLFSRNISLRPSIAASVVCCSLAGFCGGMFGISGPPVGLYYLAVTKTKEEYLGTLNAFFSVVVVFNIAVRTANGYVLPIHMPVILTGMVAILIGCAIGGIVSDRMNKDVMRKCIYSLMIFAGVIAVVQGIK